MVDRFAGLSIAALVLAAGASLTAGCSSSSAARADAGPSAGDGTAGAGGGSGAGGTAGAGAGGRASTGGSAGTGSGGSGPSSCNTLAPIGDGAVQVAQSGSPPAPAGGTVADGTYLLQQTNIYAPRTVDPGYREKVTMIFSGNHIEEVDGHGLHYSITYSTSGTQFLQTPICGFSTPSSISYTATANTLIFISDDLDWQDVYARQ